ncbi:MAG: hypothetical protein AAFX00_06990 [Pseudomonadota bacterium]
MISDLLKILEAIRSASSEKEKARLEDELLSAVRTDIQRLFDDLDYPNRRRTFMEISQVLGIFDDDPQKLKEILYEMGARPKSGEGDETFWELKAVTHAVSDQELRTPERTSGIGWPKIYAILGAFAALVAIFGFFGIGNFNDLFPGDEPATKAECLAAANGNFRRISECERLFP